MQRVSTMLLLPTPTRQSRHHQREVLGFTILNVKQDEAFLVCHHVVADL